MKILSSIDFLENDAATAAEIKTSYESNTNTNAFTDAEQSKLSGIEAGATADQTAAEIKTAYESNANTNAFTDTEQTKLAGIEAGAEVTSAAKVDAAGAVMNSDESTAAMSFVVDEDNMASDSATKVPTQQSVKAFVAAEIGSALTSSLDYMGGYNAATNSPDLDTSPSGVKKGDVYTVIAAGTFFATAVEIGDVLIAQQDNATLEAHWTIVNKNIDVATTTTPGIVELATDGENAGGVAVQGNDSRLSDSRTPSGNAGGDLEGTYPNPTVKAASDSVAGKVELATSTEAEAKSSSSLAVTPAAIANFPVKKTFQITGDAVATSFSLSHNLSTKDVMVQVRENASPFGVVGVDIEMTSTSAVAIKFGVAPATNVKYDVVIIG